MLFIPPPVPVPVNTYHIDLSHDINEGDSGDDNEHPQGARLTDVEGSALQRRLKLNTCSQKSHN